MPWLTDPCSWIPAAEVEAIVGALAGPPRPHEGGCLYPLPLDAETARRREVARKFKEEAEAMAKRIGTTLETLPSDTAMSESAVIIDVSVDLHAVGERALRTTDQLANQLLGQPNRPNSARGDGWDYTQSPIAMGLPGFLGRIGEFVIMVRPQAVGVPREKIAALAAAVRDRVPDQPFTSPDTTIRAGMRSGPDPCGLLRSEEAVRELGELVTQPYLTGESSSHPDAHGNTCVYRTARQRTFRLTPSWSGGRSEMELVRGMGELLSAVLAGESSAVADTLEGPWDEAIIEAATGDLILLKGDRTLRVSWVTSATDISGAMRLARVALERLGTTGR